MIINQNEEIRTKLSLGAFGGLRPAHVSVAWVAIGACWDLFRRGRLTLHPARPPAGTPTDSNIALSVQSGGTQLLSGIVSAMPFKLHLYR